MCSSCIVHVQCLFLFIQNEIFHWKCSYHVLNRFVVTGLNCSLLALAWSCCLLFECSRYILKHGRSSVKCWHIAADLLQHYHVVQKLGDIQTYCNITVLFESSVTCWHITTLPHCSKAQQHADILQHYHVVQKHVYMLSYWNINMLFTSSVTYWHIATLPCCWKAQWHADILQHYHIVQKLSNMLTNCNITTLFKSSMTCWNTRWDPNVFRQLL